VEEKEDEEENFGDVDVVKDLVGVEGNKKKVVVAAVGGME